MRILPGIMELNVWLQSTISANPTFDEATKKWTVVVNREGEAARTMHVSQLASHSHHCRGFLTNFTYTFD